MLEELGEDDGLIIRLRHGRRARVPQTRREKERHHKEATCPTPGDQTLKRVCEEAHSSGASDRFFDMVVRVAGSRGWAATLTLPPPSPERWDTGAGPSQQPLSAALQPNLSDNLTSSSEGRPRAAPETNLSDNQTGSSGAREKSPSNRFSPGEPCAEEERDGGCERPRKRRGRRTEPRGPRPAFPCWRARVLVPTSLRVLCERVSDFAPDYVEKLRGHSTSSRWMEKRSLPCQISVPIFLRCHTPAVLVHFNNSLSHEYWPFRQPT